MAGGARLNMLRSIPAGAMPLETIAGLFGERFGAPAPVLALHGWGRSRHDWSRVLADTGGLALDLPGFGATPPPDRSMGAAGYAEAIAPVLDSFPSPVAVAAHSFGGRVAVNLAGQRPDKVSGLVLTGVPLVRLGGKRARMAFPYRMIRAARRLRLIPERRLEEARRRYGSADYRAATGVMRQVLTTVVGESYEEQLSRLRCPVRLIWGEADRVVPPEVAQRALALLEDGSLELLPGIGHDVPAEAPDRLAAAIRSLLDG